MKCAGSLVCGQESSKPVPTQYSSKNVISSNLAAQSNESLTVVDTAGNRKVALDLRK